ncbi:MAG TPA: tetratricopeptide repeat protein [Verrucomicrobiae bacterium]|nr:tetratricopeptide repeat protein [Verrucomicrobiae bacterium]
MAMKDGWKPLALASALVVAAYAYTAHLAVSELLCPNAADASYNLLVQGFRAGQLSLKKEAPPGLKQLADPYDRAANAVYQDPPYRLHDLSYYKGRLYLYFGVTPALLLFWPAVALTGHYLSHGQAVVFFCVAGFLASVGLLRALWLRYFAEVSAMVVAACALALGLTIQVPTLLAQSDIYAVPISCGYALAILALGSIWRALHEPEHRPRWVALASAAYGLAVGARPDLLFGAVILLVPVARAWRERGRVSSVLIATLVPILLIGSGLMLYNVLRFNDPFEFGWHYVLAAKQQETQQVLSPRNFPFNFRLYFLSRARWSFDPPFVRASELHAPPGYYYQQRTLGILTNIPLVWLALAAPLAWRGRSQAGPVLRWFVGTVVLLFGICALTVCLYCGVAMRYEVDFLPALMLAAIVGILGLERVLSDRPRQRRIMRWSWGLLLAFSVLFNLLATVEDYAEDHYAVGTDELLAGRVQDAMGQYEEALRLKPDYADVPYSLGNFLASKGNLGEAIRQYEQALRIKSDYPEAHNNLGVALQQMGRSGEAMAEYEVALRLRPDFGEAHYNLAKALSQAGRIAEAIPHYEQALRFRPALVIAHEDLGLALRREGKMARAIAHLEQAVRIAPDDPEAHNNLGETLQQVGRIGEAVGQYQEALRLKPDLVIARSNLAAAVAQTGQSKETTEP